MGLTKAEARAIKDQAAVVKRAVDRAWDAAVGAFVNPDGARLEAVNIAAGEMDTLVDLVAGDSGFDLDGATKDDIKAELDRRGVDYTSKATKDELIDLL